MSGLQIALLVVYVVCAFIGATAAWALLFSDHLGDPFLAGFGLLLAIILGATWPLWVAVSPLGFLVYGVGLAIVRTGGGR